MRGGMGVVHRAFDTVLGREVAVKVLQERFGPNSAVSRRFIDEARIAGQLQHPGVPVVHDMGTLAGGQPFLAMKLVKGRTLEDLLKEAQCVIASIRGDLRTDLSGGRLRPCPWRHPPRSKAVQCDGWGLW